MARGIFITGFTIEEVVKIQAKAKDMLMEGKTILSSSGAGLSASKQVFAGMRITDVLQECAYALKKLDPVTYGAVKTYVRSTHGGDIAL